MSFPLQHIFLMEQKEYKEEGITWETITYKDNKPILVRLCSKPFSLSVIIVHYFQLFFFPIFRLSNSKNNPELCVWQTAVW